MRNGQKFRVPLAWVAVAAVLAAWGVGIARCPFDYDEIYHAHTIWLIWKGEIPFHDFFSCHPPFAWYPFAPLWSLFPERPETLILFRVCSALGVAVWLIVMAENLRLERPEIRRSQMAVGLVVVLSAPSILQDAVEFRPDSWCYALLFAAILMFRREWPRAPFCRMAIFAFLLGIAVISAPKCVLLASFFVLFVSIRPPAGISLCSLVAGMALGAGLALLGCWMFLKAAGMEPAVVYNFGIRYQMVFDANTAFRYGLFKSLVAHPWLLALTVSGLAAWGVSLKRKRLRPNAFELALLAFLIVQPFLVQRPYKQYYGPWFLTGAGFLPFLGAALPSSEAKLRTLYLGAVVVAFVSCFYSFLLFAQQNGAQTLLTFYRKVLEHSDSEAKIAAWPPFHPVLRRDTFYAWSKTYDPSGFSTERIVQQLGSPEYARRFEAEGYWHQLETNPPEIIVSFIPGTTSYEPKQALVLNQFLRKHRAEYILVKEDVPCPIWLRKSRFQQPSNP